MSTGDDEASIDHERKVSSTGTRSFPMPDRDDARPGLPGKQRLEAPHIGGGSEFSLQRWKKL